MIPRKLRLQREERTPPVPSHRGSGADLGNGNQRAAEVAPNSGTAPEPPLAPTGLLRYPSSKAVSGAGCGLAETQRLRGGCFWYLEGRPSTAAAA